MPRLLFLFLLISIALSAQDKDTGAKRDSPPKESQEVFVAGGDVKPPKIIHYVEPDFSPSSDEAYVEGIVRLSAVVNLDGLPDELNVLKGLSESEDKLALAALKQWRFKPGTKKDQPVRVRITVEINFHLL